LCGKWNVEINASGERFSAEYSTEVSRHYSLEPHHPEYEKIHFCDPMTSESSDPNRHYPHCTEADVVEMSIDRLERSLALTPGGRGPLNWDNVKKYWPVFYVDDLERKSKLYEHSVLKYEKAVAQVVGDNWDRQCWPLESWTGTDSGNSDDMSDNWGPEVTPTDQPSVTVFATSDRVVITLEQKDDRRWKQE
jgi:hypothetical protein